MSVIRYTEDHEWVRPETDGTVTIGITGYAVEQLGDIVFVELPEVGRRIAAGEEAVVIESIKTAADIKMPIGGEVVAVNATLEDAPETVNSDPLEAGWFLKIRPDDTGAVAGLLDLEAYERLVGA